MIKLTDDGMRYITLFENLTGASVLDCIVEEDRVIFVIRKGDMGIAIGKRGANINMMRKTLGKHIELVEYSDDASEFLVNTFQPARVNNISFKNEGDRQIAYVHAQSGDKGLAIGKSGRNIKKVKLLAQRHHKLDDVIIK